MKLARLALAVLLWPLVCASAMAESATGYIDELRFGGTSLDFAFEKSFDYYVYHREGLNAEVLFNEISFGPAADYEPGSFFHSLLTPRPHLGATVSLDSEGTSSLYAGLTWHQELGSIFFIEGSFGAAIHNGKMDEYEPIPGQPGKVYRGLGSPVLFRESIAIGASITENLNVIVQLSHMSHAGLAGEANAGQTDLAVKLGWEF
ncbi:MAG: acyloxyacyl hydrolase [Pseudomonadota bacterium]